MCFLNAKITKVFQIDKSNKNKLRNFFEERVITKTESVKTGMGVSLVYK